MPARTALTCSRCNTTADVPHGGDHRPLWNAGWRWIGSQNLFSCPNCPQVVTVDQDGRHHRGPGAAGSLDTAPLEPTP